MTFKTTLLAATTTAAVVFGGAASAATVLSFGDDGGIFDVLDPAGYTFDEDFADGEAAGMLSFTFQNFSASDVAVTLSAATITQTNAASFFAGGATVSWGSAGVIANAAQGVTASGNVTFNLGAGLSDTLTLSYGAVTSAPIDPNIDFTVVASVAAVPLPAGILLMGTALGGLGIARSRKAKKANA